MKPTKDHISLETARLLKDCGVESDYYFVKYEDGDGGDWKIKSKIEINKIYMQFGAFKDYIKTYTWQEILWEYAEDFFGKERDYTSEMEDMYNFETKPVDILYLLQQKKYKEADKYFRDNCILIK